MSMIRSRWAAVGAAVAVTLGAGGISLAQAAIGTGDKPIYIALDAPCRVIDTRPGDNNLGTKNTPIGAGETNAYEIQITGPNGDCTGNLAVPAAAVAVATNVTAIAPVAPSGRSFFTVYPADAALPTTSNLNFLNGQAPVPNKVDVGLSATGKIKIFNFDGTAHAAVDIFGYYIDHHHDDRYYTESETDGKLGVKANTADVYTKTQADAALAGKADTVDLEALPDVLSATVEGGIPSSLVRGVGATSASRSNPGNYRVEFDRDVSACTYIASPGEHTSGQVNDAMASVQPDVTDAFRVVVRIDDFNGNPADASFHLVVVCTG